MLELIIMNESKALFEGRARSVMLPGEQGVFELLPYHKPLLSRLIGGKVIINNEQEFPVRRGIVGFNLNRATVIVEE